MQKKITETTALYGIGEAYQAKLFRVASGAYLGRRAALIQTSPTEIKLAWSDSPGAGWSSLLTVASDADDYSFDAVMTAAGDLHVVYVEQTTNYLVTKKLTLGAGTWSVGSKVTVYNGAQAFEPSLAVEPGGKLWVAFSRFVSPTRWIQAKSSTDSGAIWGSGPADAGDQLSSGSTFAWSQVVIDNNSVHVIFHDQDTALSIRSQPISGGSWSSQYNIATGSNFGRHFHAAVGADGRLGITFYRDQLYYREYDGSNWGAVAVLETEMVMCPQLVFEGNVPAVVYLKHIGNDLKVAMFTDRRTGSFSGPQVLDQRMAPFDAVVLYDASSAGYEDLTAPAASSASADVYHSSSGCLVKDANDILYLGQDARFRLARLVLSTAGVGGTVLISYWDGANWQAFTPQNGSTDLGSTTIDLLLWTDAGAMPDDWQKRTISSQTRYWLKIEVDSAFSTGPVATQISAGSETNRIIFRR